MNKLLLIALVANLTQFHSDLNAYALRNTVNIPVSVSIPLAEAAVTAPLKAPSVLYFPHPKLQQLEKCESRGADGEPRWNIRIVDTNGFYSYGGLQFQLETFKRYGRKYDFILESESEDKIRGELIYRKDLQEAIASKILEEPGGWKNWKNCWLKINGDTESNSVQM